jgi:hypothetical protein
VAHYFCRTLSPGPLCSVTTLNLSAGPATNSDRAASQHKSEQQILVRYEPCMQQTGSHFNPASPVFSICLQVCSMIPGEIAGDGKKTQFNNCLCKLCFSLNIGCRGGMLPNRWPVWPGCGRTRPKWLSLCRVRAVRPPTSCVAASCATT